MTATIERHGGSEAIRATLPPARTMPLAADVRLPRGMPYRERFLAEQFLGARDVYLAVPTRTRIDVGSWLLRGRVWLFALADELALVACGACGRRWYVRRIAYADLLDSRYNHVTGQLALAGAGPLPFRGLKMPPLEGYQVLAQIYQTKE